VINLLISLVAFAAIVLCIILESRHPSTGNYFFNLYFILMVFVQIPMLHYLIVNQENKQQNKEGDQAASWTVEGYDN
jgi:hypothetical protein